MTLPECSIFFFLISVYIFIYMYMCGYTVEGGGGWGVGDWAGYILHVDVSKYMSAHLTFIMINHRRV